MPNKQPSLRLFACMKTRQDGRTSCGALGAAEIMSALRLELMRRGQPAAHIDVRPCGCLDQCEKGPIVLGFTGEIAEATVPPKKLLDRLVHRPNICFERMSIEQVPTIVDRILTVKT